MRGNGNEETDLSDGSDVEALLHGESHVDGGGDDVDDLVGSLVTQAGFLQMRRVKKGQKRQRKRCAPRASCG